MSSHFAVLPEGMPFATSTAGFSFPVPNLY